MKKMNLIKITVATIFLTLSLIGCAFLQKSERQTVNSTDTPEKIIKENLEIAGYKKWTKVNDKPMLMASSVSTLCANPTQAQNEMESKNPHTDKFINVFVNSIGKDEMMTKKHPQFPERTVIVKEKLPSSDNTSPELLTVMIKREKGFNPENGDWEYMTLNGEATQITARGKLESCQTCHAADKLNDYVSRRYLPNEVWKKLN